MERGGLGQSDNPERERRMMYPYLSPSGAGWTPNKALADRMEALRKDYIEACKAGHEGIKKSILDDEKQVVMLIHNDKYEAGILRPESMPRCIRVISYEHLEKRTDAYHVYLDLNEVEMISVPTVAPFIYEVRMKSGKCFDINEDDFNRIEKALRARV